jgi:uncharacterized alkaline shock family protein YloU
VIMNEQDNKEIQPTIFLTDIETKVFQAIAFQVLKEIGAVELIEGSIFDSLLGGEEGERMKGIHVECHETNPIVNIKIEVNVLFGICIPQKSLEIEQKIKEKIKELTGFHVGLIHVTFKNIIFPKSLEELIEKAESGPSYGTNKEMETSQDF